MKRTMLTLLLALILVSVLVLSMPMTGSAAGNPNPTIFPPQSKPFGLTYGQWAGRWWQWQLGQPVPNNPNLDTTGEFCAVGQKGPVWFLAGSFGGTVSRKCTVPPGKAILFPIVNEIYIGFPWDETDTAEKARTTVKLDIDKVTTYEAEVDGVALKGLDAYRLYKDKEGLNSLPIFDINLLEDNFWGVPTSANPYHPCSDDGYYIMLTPLPPGTHQIHFHGSSPTFEVDVSYELKVAK